MIEYHKIPTVWKRNPETKFKNLINGEWATPELEYLKDNEWIFTEKVDGTNIRVIWDHNKMDLKYKGKTDNAQIPPFLLDRLSDMFSEGFMSEFFRDTSICLYGEGYGAKIQKGGGNYRPDQSFVLFDVKIGDWWLQRKDVEDIAQKLNIDIVPIIFKGTLIEMIVEVSKGFKSQWGNFQAEGLVGRPEIELKDRAGHRIITKVKYKDFR